jgi:hypothetical protein
MANSFSILRKAKLSDMNLKPFPHLVIKECLDHDLYDELSRTYPSDDLIANLNTDRVPNGLADQNCRNDISAAKAINSRGKIPQIWQDFIDYHISSDFYQEVLSLFGFSIYKYYPWLPRIVGDLRNAGTGIRFDPDTDTQPFSLDCQVGINTPATVKSSVIEAHTDSPKELYAGLLYFKQLSDQANGGDLELYRWKSSKRRKFSQNLADKRLLKRVGTCKYKANTLFFFLNTIDSVHGVTPREPSSVSRRLVNIIGEVYNSVPFGLYARESKDDGIIHRIKGKAKSLLAF